MRKSLLSLLVLLILSPFCRAVPGPELLFAAAEWPPYTGTGLRGGGLAAEIVTEAFQRVGYRVEFKVFPWLRAQNMVRNGQLDGMGIAWYTRERAGHMAYSRPYLKTEIVLIKHRDDQRYYDTPEQLDNKHFGVLRGYGYRNLVDSDGVRTTVLDNLEQSFHMLAKKRIDLTLEERLNAGHRLSQLPADIREAIAFVPRPLEVKDLHLTISHNRKDHQRIIADFNRGLKLIVEDGTYRNILHSWQPLPLGIEESFQSRPPRGSRLSGYSGGK